MIDGRRASHDAEGLEEHVATARRGIGDRLVALGISADLVTAAGVALAAANAVFIGLGYLYVACVLLIVGGLMDTLDGVVAKAAGTTSKRGAFLDSVADRVADAFLFGGLAYYLAVSHHPRAALLPVAVLGVSSVISYERAKAESLGFSAKGGIMERAERLIVFGLSMLVHVVMIEILWVLLGLCCVTAIGRFVRVWRQASADVPDRPVATATRWRHGRVESRWRPLRESGTPSARGAWAGASRSRRTTEPLSTRLRTVFVATEPRPARGRRTAGARSARALRHRVDGGRGR